MKFSEKIPVAANITAFLQLHCAYCVLDVIEVLLFPTHVSKRGPDFQLWGGVKKRGNQNFPKIKGGGGPKSNTLCFILWLRTSKKENKHYKYIGIKSMQKLRCDNGTQI